MYGIEKRSNPPGFTTSNYGHFFVVADQKRKRGYDGAVRGEKNGKDQVS
ncbi:Uncharacterized protein APZ42_017050 [Daphnia magna]|uniref:Uncharacterized protein n=1 Tax=Daphnia magna TaxID=35525 RepID=A0A165AAJ1_9CRUS|nr:Uncharacterized protein APZ42_017050 [Daphnia magna]